MSGRVLIGLGMAVWAAMAQETARVVVDGEELWEVRAPRAGFGAVDRARDIGESIVHVAADGRRSPEDVREVKLDTETFLLVSRAYLFSVTEEDARLEGRDRAELFAERKRKVLEVIARYRARRTVGNLLEAAGLATGACALGLLLLWLVWRLYRRIAAWGHRLVSRRTRESEMASWFRVFERPLMVLVRWGSRLLFGAASGLVILGAVSYVLSLFPATQGWAGSITAEAWRLSGVVLRNLVDYLPNLVVLAMVAGITYVLVRGARTLARAIEHGTIAIEGFHPEWAKPTYDLVKVLFLLFALVVAFPYLPGGESPALKGASIFVGVLVSLGSGSAMGNVVSGVILTYMRPFRVGDRVQIADTTGDVLEKSLLVTRVRTIKNVEVIVPNSSILGAHILNYSAQARERGLILHPTVTLGYDAPWRRVHELMIRAAQRTEGILPDPKPFVLQTSLNDSHISYELNAYTAQANRMAELYSELNRNLQEEFNGAGVEILSPMYIATRDGNKITIPGRAD